MTKSGGAAIPSIGEAARTQSASARATRAADAGRGRSAAIASNPKGTEAPPTQQYSGTRRRRAPMVPDGVGVIPAAPL